jgi:hypothetical protein
MTLLVSRQLKALLKQVVSACLSVALLSYLHSHSFDPLPFRYLSVPFLPYYLSSRQRYFLPIFDTYLILDSSIYTRLYVVTGFGQSTSYASSFVVRPLCEPCAGTTRTSVTYFELLELVSA